MSFYSLDNIDFLNLLGPSGFRFRRCLRLLVGHEMGENLGLFQQKVETFAAVGLKFRVEIFAFAA